MFRAARSEARCFLPWPKLCSRVIALGFKNIVVFVFDLPAHASCGHDPRHIVRGDFEVGDKAVAVKNLSLGIAHGEFTPVDFQGVLALGQWDLVGQTIGVVFPGGAFFDARLEDMQVLVGLEQAHPVVEGLMGIGFADVDKMKVVKQGLSAEGLLGVNIIPEQGGLQ